MDDDEDIIIVHSEMESESKSERMNHSLQEENDDGLRNDERSTEVNVDQGRCKYVTVNSPQSAVYNHNNSSMNRNGHLVTGNSRSPPSSDRLAGGHIVVIAIDFGTTYSGYAFSFTSDPKSIHMMRRWKDGDPGVTNQKTLTTLLLTPKGNFHSFGYTARNHYHDLTPEQTKNWLYFEKFKMALYDSNNIQHDVTIKALNGVEFPAKTVFAHAMRFFRQNAIDELNEQTSVKLLEEDIRWVVTVPAIWSGPAKQFMREAAYEAGIASAEYPDKLLVTLEPEAASIFVRGLRLYELIPEVTSDKSLRPGTLRKLRIQENDSPETVAEKITTGVKYMVVDCGGGTVDIAVHEIDTATNTLKEVTKASGGPYGSSSVDTQFETLLIKIFGLDFINSFKTKRSAGWVDMMLAFESRKRAAHPQRSNPLNVSLPFSFIDYYKKYTSSSVDKAIRKYNSSDVLWSSEGMMRLLPKAMVVLFEPALTGIKKSIGDVLDLPCGKDIEYIFLVGGFSESPILQLEIRKCFGERIQVLIPHEASLAVLKGAVGFGLDPSIVSSRRSRLTYGVGVLNKFVAGKHPEKKLIRKDGSEWCTDVFDKFVLMDQPVGIGDVVLRNYVPAKPGQTSIVLHVYSTSKKDVQFITDKGAKKCGTLYLDLADAQYTSTLNKRRIIQTRMTFGQTEIKVSALDVATGKCVKAVVDFLNK